MTSRAILRRIPSTAMPSATATRSSSTPMARSTFTSSRIRRVMKDRAIGCLRLQETSNFFCACTGPATRLSAAAGRLRRLSLPMHPQRRSISRDAPPHKLVFAAASFGVFCFRRCLHAGCGFVLAWPAFPLRGFVFSRHLRRRDFLPLLFSLRRILRHLRRRVPPLVAANPRGGPAPPGSFAFLDVSRLGLPVFLGPPSPGLGAGKRSGRCSVAGTRARREPEAHFCDWNVLSRAGRFLHECHPAPSAASIRVTEYGRSNGRSRRISKAIFGA